MIPKKRIDSSTEKPLLRIWFSRCRFLTSWVRMLVWIRSEDLRNISKRSLWKEVCHVGMRNLAGMLLSKGISTLAIEEMSLKHKVPPWSEGYFLFLWWKIKGRNSRLDFPGKKSWNLGLFLSSGKTNLMSVSTLGLKNFSIFHMVRRNLESN